VHKAAAVNSQLLDRVVAAVNSQPPQHKVPAAEVELVVVALKQVAVAAVVAAVVAALKLTLPRQAPETSARFFLTGPGIWACCAAKRKPT
jgi:hypothetical protein